MLAPWALRVAHSLVEQGCEEDEGGLETGEEEGACRLYIGSHSLLTTHYSLLTIRSLFTLTIHSLSLAPHILSPAHCSAFSIQHSVFSMRVSGSPSAAAPRCWLPLAIHASAFR